MSRPTIERQTLNVLFGGDRSVSTLAMDFPYLSESSVRSALHRLYDKGLVDRYGWRPMLWHLTRKGVDALGQENKK